MTEQDKLEGFSGHPFPPQSQPSPRHQYDNLRGVSNFSPIHTDPHHVVNICHPNSVDAIAPPPPDFTCHQALPSIVLYYSGSSLF
ncbi:hypothetical protein QL285_033434 [Trifolium repens]|nr:hypothetical protein QL285_033434 [Trifolium repens]